MILKIAGGVGEHGRNCFEVFTDDFSFLVDCGNLGKKVPDLTEKEIKRLKYVFLTHSHGDHTAALPWLINNGFTGTILASKPTLEQIHLSYEKQLAIEDSKLDFFTWQRAGHCQGAVSYIFHVNGKTIVFSGDYREDSAVYACDPLRNIEADVAVIDCAYGHRNINMTDSRQALLNAVKGNQKILFPVPKYGRGMDLIDLFSGYPLFADGLLIQEAKKSDFWYKKPLKIIPEPFPDHIQNGIYFISDPQMRKEKTIKLSKHMNRIILTGTPKKNLPAYDLIEHKQADLIYYPVHQNWEDHQRLIHFNAFRKVIPYHSPELRIESNIIEF